MTMEVTKREFFLGQTHHGEMVWVNSHLREYKQGIIDTPIIIYKTKKFYCHEYAKEKGIVNL